MQGKEKNLTKFDKTEIANLSDVKPTILNDVGVQSV